MPKQNSIATDLIGKVIIHTDGAGTRPGICRGVFIHYNSAGTPCLGMLLEEDSGCLRTCYIGRFKVVREED